MIVFVIGLLGAISSIFGAQYSALKQTSSVTESVRQWDQASKDYLAENCLTHTGAITEALLKTESFLPNDFDNLGITWEGTAGRFGHLHTTVSGTDQQAVVAIANLKDAVYDGGNAYTYVNSQDQHITANVGYHELITMNGVDRQCSD